MTVQSFTARALQSTLAGLVMLFPAAPPARAAVSEAWVQRYNNMGSSANDRAVKVVHDSAGDIIVTGSTDNGLTGFDILTIKYSGVDGSVLWQRRYDSRTDGHSNDDYARVLAVDAGGNVVVSGNSDKSGRGCDWYTVKYAAADGALLWERHFNGSSNLNDVPQALAVDGSGDAVVTGTERSETGSGFHTVKYASADGAVLWENGIGGTALGLDGSGNVAVLNSDRTAKLAAADGALLWEKPATGSSVLAVDGNGNVVTAGATWAPDEYGDYYFDCYTTAMHAAADGALIWEKRSSDLGNGIDQSSAIAVDGGGNVAITSSSRPPGALYDDFLTAKYAAADGALLWQKRYNSPDSGYDTVRAVAVDGSGNVVVTGSARYYHAAGISTDLHTIKYASADGTVLWEKNYDGPQLNSDDFAGAVTVDGSGNVIVTGSSGISAPPATSESFDYYTAKYAAAGGALMWEKRHDGPASSADRAQAVAVDGSGNVIVTGFSNNGSEPNSSNDFYTAKYAAPGGALVWQRRYNGPANGNDEATAVAVDGSGNAVVTGMSEGDCYTAKYAALNGALLWEKRYSGIANTLSGVKAVALDVSGNVVVTGYSYNASDNADYYIAKYAAANGALLWEKRYDGPAHGYDSASAVTLDAGGNVVVTGTSFGGSKHFDYYTAKYAAANGALLWEKRYDGPAHADDAANAVAVDAGGNVVVTGFSRNGFSDFASYDSDYHTLKYAAATGALLWEKRYGAGDDFANAVAVDAGGNVIVTGGTLLDYDFDGYPDSASYYTAKYAAANGALLWEKSESGGTGSAVAVDGNGNVVVTGVITTGFHTVKYAAADGAPHWRQDSSNQTTPHAMGSSDVLFPKPDGVGESHCLALGPGGMTAIAGASDGHFGFGTVYDYETIVYRDVPGPVSFAAWAASFGLTGGDAGAGADPDRDGIPNAAEYVLGGNPASSATPHSPTVTISGGNMLLTFLRDDTSETPDVTLAVETSTDLMNWPANSWPTVFFIGSNTAGSWPGVTITENGTAPDKITITIPAGTDARRFARLKVTITP